MTSGIAGDVTQCKILPKPPNLLGPALPVVEPSFILAINLMGLFPQSSYHNEHLLVVVDSCSKSVELFPLRTATTTTIANILTIEIFTRWGTTAYLISDQGPQFTSHFQCGVVHKLTTA